MLLLIPALAGAGARGGTVVGGVLGALVGPEGIPVGAGIGRTIGFVGGITIGTASAIYLAAKAAGDDAPDPTAGETISKEKKGSINGVFPGEMRDKTREEIGELARAGDKAAQTANKLLTDRRFNKEQ